MLPDLDVIGLWSGIPYGHPLGHRGLTHSIAFGILLGLVAITYAPRLDAEPRIVFFLVALSAISHGVLDAMTNGGLGVAFFWPLSYRRFFLPWRPLYVTPLEISGFLTFRGLRRLLRIAVSEMLVIWLPAIATCSFALHRAHNRDRH
jgi:inner membrane protein